MQWSISMLIPGYWIKACVPPFFSKIAIFWTVPNAENTWNLYNNLAWLEWIKQTTTEFWSIFLKCLPNLTYSMKNIYCNGILHILNWCKKNIALSLHFPSISTNSRLFKHIKRQIQQGHIGKTCRIKRLKCSCLLLVNYL